MTCTHLPYLYGLGVIGSQTDAWSYLLPDGLTSSRQLADANGAITQATAYTPWGDTLAVNGANLAYGYLGGIMDVATGLIYVGNGQYYDPTTGRFLTRGVNPVNSGIKSPQNRGRNVHFLLGKMSSEFL